jgi:hypothetical protein
MDRRRMRRQLAYLARIKPGTRREVPSVHSRHLRLNPVYLPHRHTAPHRSRIQGEYTVPPNPTTHITARVGELGSPPDNPLRHRCLHVQAGRQFILRTEYCRDSHRVGNRKEDSGRGVCARALSDDHPTLSTKA